MVKIISGVLLSYLNVSSTTARKEKVSRLLSTTLKKHLYFNVLKSNSFSTSSFADKSAFFISWLKRLTKVQDTAVD